jgi:hypothetical protein
MRNLYRPAVLLLLLTSAGDTRAQFLLGIPFNGPGPILVGGVGFGHGRHRIDGFVTGGYFAPYPSYGSSVTIVTVYASPPPSPLVVTPAELDVLRQLNMLPRDRDQDRDEPRPPVRIGPNKGPRNPNPPAPPEKLVPPAKEKPVGKPRDLPLPGPRPAATPKAEHERLVQLGKDAFAAQQYGRAAERFRQALAADDQAPAHFLLAQAEFTLGKYFDAVDALEAGLKLDPNWPTAPFHPQALYGPDGDDFTEQLQRLQNALARHPDDPVLLFLYAYQLWFDGRRNEALPLFQRAAAVAADKAAIEKFLQSRQ